MIPLPDKKYQIIYADPPWSYNDKMAGHSFSLDHEYQVQSLKWICSLPVGGIAAKDSVLFLWAVSPQLPEALQVMTAWGFKYKTLAFCWTKRRLNGGRVANLGRWTMGNVELCMLGTKGYPKRIALDVKQLIDQPRQRHSQKPAIVRDKIVELMGDLPRIELFARQKNEGWDAWGNEVQVENNLFIPPSNGAGVAITIGEEEK